MRFVAVLAITSACGFKVDQISPTRPTVAMQTIDVASSGTNTENPDPVDCDANEILVRAPYRSGAGIDAVSLSCTTPTCL